MDKNNKLSLLPIIALAMQVHTSAAVLSVLSLLLWWKGMIKVHWGGDLLNQPLHNNLDEVRDSAARRLWTYNHERPNIALGGTTLL